MKINKAYLKNDRSMFCNKNKMCKTCEIYDSFKRKNIDNILSASEFDTQILFHCSDGQVLYSLDSNVLKSRSHYFNDVIFKYETDPYYNVSIDNFSMMDLKDTLLLLHHYPNNNEDEIVCRLSNIIDTNIHSNSIQLLHK